MALLPIREVNSSHTLTICIPSTWKDTAYTKCGSVPTLRMCQSEPWKGLTGLDCPTAGLSKVHHGSKACDQV